MVGEVPANNSTHKSMAVTLSSLLLSQGDMGHQHYKAKADREQLFCGADPEQTLPVTPQAPLLLPVPHPTHPALLLLLLGISILAAANAGVAGDAVEAGDAVRGVLPLDAQLWGPPDKQERLGKEGSATCNSPNARAPYGPPSLHPIPPPTQHLLSSWSHFAIMIWGSDIHGCCQRVSRSTYHPPAVPGHLPDSPLHSLWGIWARNSTYAKKVKTSRQNWL